MGYVNTTGYIIEFTDGISRGSNKIEYGDTTMETKLHERSKNVRFQDESFFNTL